MRWILARSVIVTTLLAAACSTPSQLVETTPDAGAWIPPEVVEGTCAVDAANVPDALDRIDCRADFLALASEPLDVTIPGARSVKVMVDTADAHRLHFQNSQRFEIHYAYASTHLSGGALPVVPTLSEFNATEYFSPERRFILGAVTLYEGPNRWALELSPYDTASAEMIATLYEAVRAHAYFGPALAFHPTSEAVASTAKNLPASVPLVTTETLYAGTDYQPLNTGVAIGRVTFAKAAALDPDTLTHDDLVVLDEAPNDIGVVQGLVTEAFQTPLSHVNVLARNRGTPNMGLRGAMSHPQLRALEGKLARLEVTLGSWSIREASQAEATAFWEAHRPTPVTLPALDLGPQTLVNIEAVTPDATADITLRERIKEAARAYGGKAAQYSIVARTPGVPVRKAFAIPVSFYARFMEDNGFYARVRSLLADATFNTDATKRAEALALLRADMMKAPLEAGLETALRAKISAEYPGVKMRFRTSTNSEDLDGFPCAGCYESHTGDPADWEDVRDAIRETWASAWLSRTFDERTYYGVAHESVGMALLVHANFPDEEANGVAVTANPFDASGLDPAYYVNVQKGGSAEVVHPPPGVTSDQLLLYFSLPNQPVSYLAHSNIVPAGKTVLTGSQLRSLGLALQAIHARFSAAYGPAAGHQGWYAMDVEFKFDDDGVAGREPALFIKQARPYPRSKL